MEGADTDPQLGEEESDLSGIEDDDDIAILNSSQTALYEKIKIAAKIEPKSEGLVVISAPTPSVETIQVSSCSLYRIYQHLLVSSDKL